MAYDKEYRKKYYESHRDKFKEYIKKYRKNHKERYKEYKKKYYQTHREEILAWRKARVIGSNNPKFKHYLNKAFKDIWEDIKKENNGN